MSLTLAAALLLGAVPSSTSVEDLPAWAREVARTIAPGGGAESGRDTPDARVLLAETEVEVFPNGDTVVRARRAVQVRRIPAGRAGSHVFLVEPGFSLRTARAFHVPPAPTREADAVHEVEYIADPSLFSSDARTRLLQVGSLRPGSLVLFEFESFGPQPTLDLVHLFGDPLPQDVHRYRIQLPPGWSLDHEWLRVAGPEPERTGRTWTWTLHDLKRDRPVPLASAPADRDPRLALTLLPPFRPDHAVPLPSWIAVAKWYEELAKERDALTPALHAMADRACPPAVTDPWGRIHALASYVRNGVRYVAREVGIGAFQPRPASATAATLVGDCKDKATLLRSLLAARGIASYPLLVNLSHEDTVPSRVPTLAAFNHFVVAVRIPGGAVLPEDVATAVLEAGPLGRLVILDVTQDSLAPGAVSASLGGKRALLIAGSNSKIVTLPRGSAAAHRIERTLDIQVEQASATWRQVTRLRGEPATVRRVEHRRDSAASRRRAQAALDDRWPGAQLRSFDVEPEGQDGVFTETMAWTTDLEDLPPSGTNSHFPFVEEDLPRTSLSRRSIPVVYPFPLSLSYTVRLFPAPEGETVPPSIHLSASGWEVDRTWSSADGVRRTTLEARLDQTTFAPEAFGGLREFWSALAGAGGP